MTITYTVQRTQCFNLIFVDLGARGIKLHTRRNGQHPEDGKKLATLYCFLHSKKKDVRKSVVTYKGDFTCSYVDLKGIPLVLFQHYIYLKDDVKPDGHPQISLNWKMMEVVREEIRNLLYVGFIYPISNSKWASPLVAFVKKYTQEWRVYQLQLIEQNHLQRSFPLTYH